MAFVEQRFFEDIRPMASGGPQYRTNVLELRGGGTHRNSVWADPIRTYSLSLGPRDQDSIAAILDFVATMQGGLHSFRMKDYSDFEAENELLGTGNGVDFWFRLRKSYGTGGYWRRILKPRAGTVVVRVNGVPVSPADFAVDTVNGLVILKNAPANGQQVHADYEFDVPVYFSEDAVELLMLVYHKGQWADIKVREDRLKEVIDEDAIYDMRP